MSNSKLLSVRSFSSIIEGVIENCRYFWEEDIDNEDTFDSEELENQLISVAINDILKGSSAVDNDSVLLLVNPADISDVVEEVVVDWAENSGIDSSYLMEALFQARNPLDFRNVQYVVFDV